jgi:hypothetical protein
LLLHERLDERGASICTWVETLDGELWVVTDGGERLGLPAGAIQAVMRRYAKPLQDPPEETGESPLMLEDKSVLFRMRFLPTYDVISKDYLVWQVPGEHPVAELATHVTAALEHLARATKGLTP